MVPRDLSWLDPSTTPREPAVRIGLNPKTPSPGSTGITVSQVTTSPVEQMLNNIAMRLLATGSAFGPDIALQLYELAMTTPGPLTGTADGLGDVIAALQASGALSPLKSGARPSRRAVRTPGRHRPWHHRAALPREHSSVR